MQSGNCLFNDITMWNYYREAWWLSLYIRETPICCGKDELRTVVRIAVDLLTFRPLPRSSRLLAYVWPIGAVGKMYRLTCVQSRPVVRNLRPKFCPVLCVYHRPDNAEVIQFLDMLRNKVFQNSKRRLYLCQLEAPKLWPLDILQNLADIRIVLRGRILADY